jgi:hypothetical protein
MGVCAYRESRAMSTWHLKHLEALNLYPILIEIMEWIKSQFGLDLVITQVYKEGMEGKHVDLRCPDDVIGPRIEQEVNRHFQYDPERPRYQVAWWHKADEPGAEYHLHTQVCKNTVRIL